MKKKIGKRGLKTDVGMRSIFENIDIKPLIDSLSPFFSMLRTVAALEAYKAQFGSPLLKTEKNQDKKTC